MSYTYTTRITGRLSGCGKESILAYLCVCRTSAGGRCRLRRRRLRRRRRRAGRRCPWSAAVSPCFICLCSLSVWLLVVVAHTDRQSMSDCHAEMIMWKERQNALRIGSTRLVHEIERAPLRKRGDCSQKSRGCRSKIGEA
jgi:hypothetical protein